VSERGSRSDPGGQCDRFKVEPPHRKPGPYIVEGYHIPDAEMKPIDLLPKGVEIRTPICGSIEIALPR
jgi:carboxylate-amine ligase